PAWPPTTCSSRARPGWVAFLHPDSDAPQPTPAEFWERRYAEAGQVWSGRANQALVDVVADLGVGRALDLGCGEGGARIWPARAGGGVPAVGIPAPAIARAKEAASDVPDERIDWVVADLDEWTATGRGPYDLVTASFLHGPVQFPRTGILRRAAA